jgi:3-dehydroquinate synthetase
VTDLASPVRVSSRSLQIGDHEFRYHHGYRAAPDLADVLSVELQRFDRLLVVVDRAVRAQYETLVGHLDDSVEVEAVYVDAHEGNKTLDLVGAVMERAVAVGINRRSAVVAMGGGFAGNISGMVAALLFRGLPLVHLPTSPIAAFDSVLSAKQAVNLSHGKNLCGTYLAPELVACDLAWLESVPADEFTTGMAEMVKNVLAVAPERREELLEAIRSRGVDPRGSLEVLLDIGVNTKSPFLAKDPYERREALVFEYGHTIGHAVEFASAGVMGHGEAVAWGMLVAAQVAHAVTGLSIDEVREHHRLTDVLLLDRGRLLALDPDRVMALVASDNKRGYLPGIGAGHVPMVLLEALGAPALFHGRPLVPVTVQELREALDVVIAG